MSTRQEGLAPPTPGAEGDADGTRRELAGAVESILFVAGGPVPVEKLAEALGADRVAVAQAVRYLQQRTTHVTGLLIQAVAGGYQLGTHPEHADAVRQFLQNQHSDSLTRGALETLAIIAYRQPATRGDVEQIRGVRSDWHIERLLERQLIREMGRRPTVGRPMLFGTTELFLRYFGLNDLAELPPMGTRGVQTLLDAAR